MFVTQDGHRLYLDNWGYNALLILGELKSLVELRGGRVKPAKTAIISNRSVESNIMDYKGRIKSLEDTNATAGYSEKRAAVIADLSGRVAELELFDNNPIPAYGQSWINFILDGKVYYLSLDNNPFFEFHYIKTPLRDDGTYSKDASVTESDKSWLLDVFFSHKATGDDRRDAAEKILRWLMVANDTPIIRKTKKVRVHNAYNDGWHTETMYATERIATLDY